ncbi:MAG TPA: histidinol-phosphate transaminase [Aeromicrobium sp.]|nr:histidinol-phosphate transaminase [Aeromicrobium sp.]
MSFPQPRTAVQSIAAYRAGARSTEESLKLSSNENPFGPLPGVLESATAALGQMNRYPDPATSQLRELLANRLRLAADQLCFGTGSVAVLYALLNAWCAAGDEVVYAWRSFEAYPIAVELTGARSVQIALTRDGRHDLSAMASAITEQTKVVLVCSPNNPTGTVVGAAEFEEFMAQVRTDVLVVLDEAYAEFVRDDSAVAGLAILARHENLVVLRTFSKAYGLAGLRVGYAMGPAPIVEAIDKVLPTFGVSDIAQAAAVASLAAEAELGERVDLLVAERERVATRLRELGFSVPTTQGNFVWLELPGRSAEFGAHVAPVAVRGFAEGVRVSIGTPSVNDAFLAAATTFKP